MCEGFSFLFDEGEVIKMKYIKIEALKEYVSTLTEEEKEEKLQTVLGKMIMQQAKMESGNPDDMLEFADTIVLMAELGR